MLLKANLHFHSGEDPYENVAYSIYEGIDRAAALGIEALAVTCHRTFVWKPEYAEYAASKKVLLIPGIEVNLDEKRGRYGRHTVILNCDKSAEKLETFADLKEYRKNHPEIFVIAPHPFYYGFFSLKKYLEKYIRLFDAIEQSWYYSKFFNRNKKAEAMAKKHNLPYISTSDTHFFDFLGENYAVISAEEKTIPAIFRAIRERKFENVTRPRFFWRDMVWVWGKYFLRRLRRGLLL